MLTLDTVSVSYGAVQALKSISLRVNAGEIVTILGSNGAGKSSLLRAISGLVPLRGGSVRLGDKRLDLMKPHEIVAAGVGHCPEGRRIFPELTVLENLDMGAYTLSDRAMKRTLLQQALAYFPILTERRWQKAGTLSGGEQQMLAVARALVGGPTLLMLDEPSLGLAPMIMDQIFEIIVQINRVQQTTILLVEQNANEALLHAHRGYVLEGGRLVLEGTAEVLRRNPKVREVYLGVTPTD